MPIRTKVSEKMIKLKQTPADSESCICASKLLLRRWETFRSIATSPEDLNNKRNLLYDSQAVPSNNNTVAIKFRPQ